MLPGCGLDLRVYECVRESRRLFLRSSVKKIERSGCNPIRAADSQEARVAAVGYAKFFIFPSAGNLSSVSSTGQSRSTPFNGFGVHLGSSADFRWRQSLST